MSVIYVLLAISIIVAVIFFIAFIVSVRSGQYDDAYTPSVRMLFEDELVRGKPSKKKPEKEKNRLCEERSKLLNNSSKQTDCHATLAMTGKNNPTK